MTGLERSVVGAPQGLSFRTAVRNLAFRARMSVQRITATEPKIFLINQEARSHSSPGVLRVSVPEDWLRGMFSVSKEVSCFVRSSSMASP